jgi:small subunit ribosomal protein S6
MPLYESVVIARQDISSAQVDTLADDLTKILEDNGGKVAKRENWGLRSLAFRIKKNRKGHYVMFNVDAPAEAVAEYERRMRINEDVLRYMTVRVEEHEEGESAILSNKGRGGREGGRDGGRRDGGRDGGRFESGRRGPRDDNSNSGDNGSSNDEGDN